MDDHDRFLLEVESKLRDQGFKHKNWHRCADHLEENKAQAKQFLIKHFLTKAYMTDSEWNTDKNGHIVFGKMTNNMLINTNGVRINPYGDVLIAHFDQDGLPTTPYIICTEYGFDIIE